MSNDLPTLPVYLEQCVLKELARDEEILWVGQPVPRRFIVGTVLTMFIAFPLCAGCTALFLWLLLTPPGPAPGCTTPVLIGVTVLAIYSILTLLSPWILEYSDRRTVYLITDRRALSFRWVFIVKARKFPIEELQNVTLYLHRRNRLGDLILKEGMERLTPFDLNKTHRRHGFRNIRDWKTPCELLIFLTGHTVMVHDPTLSDEERERLMAEEEKVRLQEVADGETI